MKHPSRAGTGLHLALRNLARRIGRSVVRPPIRWVQRKARAAPWMDMRRITPVSRSFGFDRGNPVDRFYIERFLAAHAADVRGDVLEIANSHYSRQFGGDRVTCFHVLHAVEGNPDATIAGDLVSGKSIPPGAFDCIILTQTLPFIYDLRAAIATCHRVLRPGGIVLCTLSGISQISRYDMDRWGDYWRFTSLSAGMLFSETFSAENVTIDTYGNVLAAVCLLHGLAAEDLTVEELEHMDPDYEVQIGVRARKAVAGPMSAA